jgi:hypothetical protein
MEIQSKNVRNRTGAVRYVGAKKKRLMVISLSEVTKRPEVLYF